MSNLNNLSSLLLLLLSGITYSTLDSHSVLFLFLLIYVHTFHRYRFQDNEQWRKKMKKKESNTNKRKRLWMNIYTYIYIYVYEKKKSTEWVIWKAPTNWLFVLLLSSIFLVRSNRRKKKKNKQQKTYLSSLSPYSCSFSSSYSACFWRAKRCNIVRIMIIINKDDQRCIDSYLIMFYTSFASIRRQQS